LITPPVGDTHITSGCASQHHGCSGVFRLHTPAPAECQDLR
jgi:hypothetical protein